MFRFLVYRKALSLLIQIFSFSVEVDEVGGHNFVTWKIHVLVLFKGKLVHVVLLEQSLCLFRYVYEALLSVRFHLVRYHNVSAIQLKRVR